jgi:molybdate/tungstate transport system substrate-binding protein
MNGHTVILRYSEGSRLRQTRPFGSLRARSQGDRPHSRGPNALGPLMPLLVLVTAGLLCWSSVACRPAAKIPLKVICAGSLIVPLAQVEKAFEAAHPNIDVLTEGHGSIQVIRQVTELDTKADLILVADQALIPPLMYVPMRDGGGNYANWTIRFATNALGLAYTAQSRYASEINAANWYQILARPDVKLGISDPRFDAGGYRAMMACWLAGVFYHDSNLFHDVLGDFEYPISLQRTGNRCTIVVPEIVKPKKINMRGSSIVLLGILESGDIDYAFEYQSVAQQHNLSFLELPSQINLGSNDYQSLGYDLRVKLDYQRFASVLPEFPCQQILYGLTIPANSPHPGEAQEYLKFLLGPDGQRIFADQHQPFLPLVADHPDRLPQGLRALVTAGQP